MRAVLQEAKKRKLQHVLYTKTGFVLREPLFLMQGSIPAGKKEMIIILKEINKVFAQLRAMTLSAVTNFAHRCMVLPGRWNFARQ